MRALLAGAALASLQVLSAATAQPGPGALPSPWAPLGAGIAYSGGGLALPAGVVGGPRGPGTLNVQQLYVNGVAAVLLSGATAPLTIAGGTLSLASGGITNAYLGPGAATANLGYAPARSGANSDVTSLSGLTTPLSAAQGGTGLAALGAGVPAALGAAIGSPGAPVTNGGALGTPSGGSAANLTGYSAGALAGLGSGVSGALAATASGTSGGVVRAAGAAIDGATIGGTTPGPGSFTTLQASGAVGLSTPLGLASGGSGSSTSAGARANYGAAASGANADITSLNGPFLNAATATAPAAGDNSSRVATSSFVTAAMASSGGRVLLATLTANNTSATLSDVTHLTSAYAEYEIVVEGLIPASSGQYIFLQVHSGGAFQSGTNTYNNGFAYSNNGSNSNYNSGGVMNTGLWLSYPATGAAGVYNSGASPNLSGGLNVTARVSNVSGTNGLKWFNVSGSYNSSGVGLYTWQGGGYWNSAAAIDGFSVSSSSGNLLQGVVKVYGWN